MTNQDVSYSLCIDTSLKARASTECHHSNLRLFLSIPIRENGLQLKSHFERNHFRRHLSLIYASAAEGQVEGEREPSLAIISIYGCHVLQAVSALRELLHLGSSYNVYSSFPFGFDSSLDNFMRQCEACVDSRSRVIPFQLSKA